MRGRVAELGLIVASGIKRRYRVVRDERKRGASSFARDKRSSSFDGSRGCRGRSLRPSKCIIEVILLYTREIRLKLKLTIGLTS